MIEVNPANGKISNNFSEFKNEYKMLNQKGRQTSQLKGFLSKCLDD